MSTALTRLKEKIAQTRVPEELTKPTKAPFVGFDGDRGRGVCPILASALVVGGARSEPQIDQAEREAIAIELGHVPVIYASEFARLQAQPPTDVARGRWHQFINDAGLFLDRWGRQAEALDWRPKELFGLDPAAPMARYDRMGLIWMLHGETVVEITATEAKLSDGLTFYRKGYVDYVGGRHLGTP
jgi:hypothetical protein